MTENMESGQDLGDQGKPNLDASGGDVKQSSPVDGVSLADVLTVVKNLEGQVRALQSDKDKGIAKVGKQVNDLAEQMEKYESYRERGLKPEQAVREMQIDALLAGQRDEGSTEFLPKEEGGTEPKVASADQKAILQRLGLQPNDPKVLEVLREKDNPIEQVASFAALALEKAKTQQAPTNEAQVMPSASGATSTETIDSLTEELNELMRESPGKHMKRITEIRAKLKEQLPRG